MTIKELKQIVLFQAKDESLWFDSTSVTESYLQSALRYLHYNIEALKEDEE